MAVSAQARRPAREQGRDSGQLEASKEALASEGQRTDSDALYCALHSPDAQSEPATVAPGGGSSIRVRCRAAQFRRRAGARRLSLWPATTPAVTVSSLSLSGGHIVRTATVCLHRQARCGALKCTVAVHCRRALQKNSTGVMSARHICMTRAAVRRTNDPRWDRADEL